MKEKFARYLPHSAGRCVGFYLYSDVGYFHKSIRIRIKQKFFRLLTWYLPYDDAYRCRKLADPDSHSNLGRYGTVTVTYSFCALDLDTDLGAV